MASGEFPITNPVDQARVAIHTPEGREFLWLLPDSEIARWEVGQSVVFRNRGWIVSGRADAEGHLTLTLDLAN